MTKRFDAISAASRRIPWTTISTMSWARACAAALACSLVGGCAVATVAGTAVGVAGAAAGAALSVGGAVVGSTVKVAGKVVEKTVEVAVPDRSPPR